MTKEETHKTLKLGEWIHFNVWDAYMADSGKVYLSCYEPGCCDMDFDDFEEFWEHYGENIE